MHGICDRNPNYREVLKEKTITFTTQMKEKLIKKGMNSKEWNI